MYIHNWFDFITEFNRFLEYTNSYTRKHIDTIKFAYRLQFLMEKLCTIDREQFNCDDIHWARVEMLAREKSVVKLQVGGGWLINLNSILSRVDI